MILRCQSENPSNDNSSSSFHRISPRYLHGFDFLSICISDMHVSFILSKSMISLFLLAFENLKLQFLSGQKPLCSDSFSSSQSVSNGKSAAKMRGVFIAALLTQIFCVVQTSETTETCELNEVSAALQQDEDVALELLQVKSTESTKNFEENTDGTEVAEEHASEDQWVHYNPPGWRGGPGRGYSHYNPPGWRGGPGRGYTHVHRNPYGWRGGPGHGTTVYHHRGYGPYHRTTYYHHHGWRWEA